MKQFTFFRGEFYTFSSDSRFALFSGTFQAPTVRLDIIIAAEQVYVVYEPYY